MSTLLVDRSGMSLRCDAEAIAVYEGEERRGSVPLALLNRCVIRGADTQLDSGVLLKLAEAGVGTVLFSPRLGRRVAVVLGPQHRDAGLRLAQSQRVLNGPACADWARQVVVAKLGRQVRVLRGWLSRRPEARRRLSDAVARVEAIRRQALQGGDVASLRGLEGAAARVYFSGLAVVVAPGLGFEGRNRRPPRDPVNVGLSLGYTMLHLEAVGLAQASGLDPLLGFYHRPSVGRESLACDLIEPLRPLVDDWVVGLFRERVLREAHFTVPEGGGACLMGKAGRRIFYDEWFKALPVWRRWLRLRCMILARQLRDEGALFLDDNFGDEVEPW